MYWVETIVCSGAKGKDAKLRRKLQSRQEYKRRQPGCVAAWLGRGPDDKTMLLVQSVFKSQKDWKRISQEIQTKLDAKRWRNRRSHARPSTCWSIRIVSR